MNDQAIVAPPSMGGRVMRMTLCFGVATAVGWRGVVYLDPVFSTAVPFAMCELTAAVVAFLGFMSLCGPGEPGPA